MWNDFEHTIRKRIIGRKDAFLLHNLLQHLQDLCKEYDIEDPIRYTYILRMELSNRFPEEVDFSSSGKYVTVYSSQVNPCDYSIATLKGSGLSDENHIRAFSNLIRKKVEKMEFSDLPSEPEKLIEAFESEGAIQISTIPYIQLVLVKTTKLIKMVMPLLSLTLLQTKSGPLHLIGSH